MSTNRHILRYTTPGHTLTHHLLTLVLGALLVWSGCAPALELRVLVAWDDNYPGVSKLAERFARKVDEASGGEVTFTVTGPDSIPAFEQLVPVSLGIFDLLFTHGSFHLETTGIGIALDAIKTTPETLRSSGLWETVDRAYQKHGLKLLAIPVAAAGYQIFLREPVTQSCRLDGRRIRAAPSYQQLLQGLGARPVLLPIGAVHAALAAKTLDGVAWSTLGTVDLKWYEVNRYVLRPTFGVVSHLLLINLDTWQNLPLDLQRLLLEEGAKLEAKAVTRLSKVAAAEMNDLHVAGMQITSLCRKGARRMKRDWAEGVWQLAIAHSGDEARALRKLARENAVTPASSEDSKESDTDAAPTDTKQHNGSVPPAPVPSSP